MRLHDEVRVHCPYCGSEIELELDPQLAGQRFIEDCPVCCSPIEFELQDAEGRGLRLVASRDDD